MLSRRYLLILTTAFSALVALFLVQQRQVVFSQSVPMMAPADDSVASFRVQFGVTDSRPSAWDGTLRVTGGEILNLRNWHPRPGDSINGKNGWSLATRQGRNFVKRPWETELTTPPVPYLLIPGIVVDVKGSSGTTVRITTKNGSFEVRPFSLEAGRPERMVGGRVVVDRVPTAQMVSTTDYQNDFATILPGPRGELWVAWVAYANSRNQVRVRHFDGKAWGAVQQASEGDGDIFLVKAARDRSGNAWFIWSAQVNGNFDLYGRRFDGKSWSAVERLTDDPQPDIYHTVARDSNGNLWLVWQGFRNGKSDIFARRYNGASWSVAETVSQSPANDWAPAIAADGEGRVYVAWDSYDKGNYDVLMRKHESGGWSEVNTIAGTLKFEADVSLACDRQNRLWAAWNESGLQWGKDTGFLPKKEGTRLYQSRFLAVAVFANGAWQEPAADLEESLPKSLQGHNDLPILQVDGAGRVLLFFRHRLPRIQDTPSDAPMHRAAWEIFGVSFQGDRWTTPVAVPFSEGRTDMRAGFAADGQGNVYAAWPTDNRDFEEFLFDRADVYAARIPALAGAAVAPKLQPRVQAELKVFPIHPKETEDLSRIHGYQITSGGYTYRIYRGDTHRHTEFSMDGNNDGSILDTYRYAIDAVQLDYLGISDHNSAGGPDVEYVNWLEQQMCDVMMLARKFVPLYGYERSLSYPNGHRNVMFATRGHPTLPIPAAERKGQTGAQALYEYLKKYDGIAISHTPATNMGTDWRDNNPQLEPLVEIYQGDRVSAEYQGAPKAAWAGNPAAAPGGFRPLGYVWNAWAKGYKLGVQASSDHLSTHISYACTISPVYTREGLLDAMRGRHSYGATDNIILDYRLDTGGKEYLQGDIVKASGGFKLLVKVIGTSPIRQIDIIKNNKFIHTRQPLEPEVDFTFVDSNPGPGQSYYYVRVMQVNNQMAWSSPIWVTSQ